MYSTNTSHQLEMTLPLLGSKNTYNIDFFISHLLEGQFLSYLDTKGSRYILLTTRNHAMMSKTFQNFLEVKLQNFAIENLTEMKYFISSLLEGCFCCYLDRKHSNYTLETKYNDCLLSQVLQFHLGARINIWKK